MKKIFLSFIALICLNNLSSQNWLNMIDSMPNSWHDINVSVVDTSSNVIYLGGAFSQINNLKTKDIVKYDGVKFDTLTSGIDPHLGIYNSSSVKSLIMFQNKLYVGGDFQRAGKYYTRNLARWNGANWDTVNFNPDGAIYDMKVYNNELYVSGSFDTIGGIEASTIAKYDGVNWHSLNWPNKSELMFDIAVFKDTVYGHNTHYLGGLLKYNGSHWVSWTTYSGSPYRQAMGLKVIDSMLYVNGTFDIAGTHCNGLAGFTGKHWYGYGSGALDQEGGRIDNVEKINGELYVTGRFDGMENIVSLDTALHQSINLAKFDGQKWCFISPPFNNVVSGIIKYNNDIYCYGSFTTMGNDSVLGFIKWTGGNTVLLCSSTITMTQTTVGLNEIKVSNNIKIYPNPATSILNIEDEQNELQKSNIEITNTMGQIVLTTKFNAQIDISELQSGMYFLTISSNASKQTIKIIKQ